MDQRRISAYGIHTFSAFTHVHLHDPLSSLPRVLPRPLSLHPSVGVQGIHTPSSFLGERISVLPRNRRRLSVVNVLCVIMLFRQSSALLLVLPLRNSSPSVSVCVCIYTPGE